MKKIMIILTIITLTILSMSKEYLIYLNDSPDYNPPKLKEDLSNRSEIINMKKENLSNSVSTFYRDNYVMRDDFEIIDAFWCANILHIKTDKSIDEIKDLMNVKAVYENKVETRMIEERGEVMNSSAVSRSDLYTYGLLNLNVPKIWSELGLKGKGVVVGVLDGMVDLDHKDLNGKIIAWFDIDGNTNPTPDPQGHGTHVTGTIVGGDAGGAHIGVAPEAKVVYSNPWSQKHDPLVSDFITAMQYLLDPDGNPNTNDFPRVINNSWSSTGFDYYIPIIDSWIELGIIPVFAAGNDGEQGAGTIRTMNSYDKNIVIGAVDKDKVIAGFSSIGPGFYNQGGKVHLTDKPEFCAQGVNVVSCYNDDKYVTMSGTSMATPHIVGLIALMLQANPNLTLENVRDILKLASIDGGEAGYDYRYGFGVVDGYQAVLAASAVPRWDKNSLIVSSVQNGRFTFKGMAYINPSAKLSQIKVYVNDSVVYEDDFTDVSNKRFQLTFSSSNMLGYHTYTVIENLGSGTKNVKIEVISDKGTKSSYEFTRNL